MRSARSAATNIHGGVAVVGDLGLLILGDSGSGKSSLAARMMAEWPFGIVRLVADDRVIIGASGGRIVARPHAAIAGRMEIRGYGIVAAPALDAAILHGVVRLEAAVPRMPEADDLTEPLLCCALPGVVLPRGDTAYPRLIALWPIFQRRMEAARSNVEPAS